MKDGTVRGIFVVATAGLVTLKLMGEIDWSWLVVFAPLWVPAAVSLGVRVASVVVVAAVVYLLLSGGWLEGLLEVLKGLPLLDRIPWERLFS